MGGVTLNVTRLTKPLRRFLAVPPSYGSRRSGPRSKALTGFCAPSDVPRRLVLVENEFGSAPLWWSSHSCPTARNSANCTTFRCRRDPKCRTVHPNGRDAGRNRGSVDRLSCDVAAPLYKRPLFARRVTKRRTRSMTNRAVLSSGLERACA